MSQPGPQMSAQSGFTLLELIVALVVMGLLMAGAVEGVHYGIKSWQAQAAYTERYAELDGVDRVLRELFTGIDSATDTSFTGEPHRVAFTGRMPPSLPLGFQRADILIMVTDDHRLVLRWTPHPHANLLATAASHDTVLLRDVESIDFNYRTVDANSGTSVWTTSTSDAIPPLIRLRIVFAKDDRRHWPDMVMTPVIVPR